MAAVCYVCATGVFLQAGFAGDADQEVVNMVIDALKSGDAQMQTGAIAIVREIPGQEIIKSLAKELPNLPHAGQVQLLSVFADRGDRIALPAVIAAIKSADASVRIAALKAVGQLGDVSSVDLLASTAAQTAGQEQKAAREGLYRLRGPEIDQVILKSLDSAETKVKVELIRSVGERNIVSGVGSLLKTAKDPDDSVRAESLRVLKTVAGPESMPALVDLLLNLQSESDRSEAEKTIAAVAHKIERSKGQSAAVLAVLASVKDVNKRASLLRVLGRIGDNNALPALQTALGSKESDVQDAAVRALSDWPSPEPLTDLLKVAQTSDNKVHKILALRGFVRLLGLPSERPAKETAELYKKALSLAANADEKKKVLSGLANTRSLESLMVAAEYLNDIALYQEAELTVLKIAQGICGSYPEQTKAVLKKIVAGTKQDEIRQQSQEVMNQIDRFGDYLTSWQVSGPYVQEGTEGSGLFDVAFAPEKPDSPAVTWLTMPAGTDKDRPWLIELDKALGGDNRAAYLRSKVWSEKTQKVTLELGSDDGIKVWLNGRLVHANNAVRPAEPGQDKVEVTLKQGWNGLLLKVTQGGGQWAVCARLRNLDGSKLEGLKIQAE